jgi:hypothetical protein
MSTLQDVRAFVKRQGDLSSEQLEAKVAREFEMSRDEAAQLMRGLSSEDPSLETGGGSLVDATVVAAGLSGALQVGGTQNAAGVGALLVNEGDAMKEADLDNEITPSR